MSERFVSELHRHRFTAREVTVLEVTHPVPSFVRVTVGGPDLHDFVSTGPTDHAKVFFPHPFTGAFHAPTPVGPDADGIVRPDAQMFGRDFTPLNVRTDPATGLPIFDLDFYRHDDPGPASAWAERAEVGDRIVVVGPRGSRSLPTGISRLLCIVDPTAFPAAVRWIEGVAPDTEIEVVADVGYDDIDWVDDYFRAATGRECAVREPLGGLDQALLDSTVDAGTFVFAAGEAGRLIPLRKAARGTLDLPREQIHVSGYWRRGEANFDHHGPLDPEDPEDTGE